jgi:hypothetical protein
VIAGRLRGRWEVNQIAETRESKESKKSEWWQNFYSGVIGHPPVECLYQLTGPCRAVSNVAGFFGAAAYDARLLWASGIVAIIGLLLQS